MVLKTRTTLINITQNFMLWLKRKRAKYIISHEHPQKSWRVFLIHNFQVFRWTGRGESPNCLQTILQEVLEAILDSWMESRWPWTAEITNISIKVHLRLQRVIQGVLKDVLDFWMETKWLWTSAMTFINIKQLCAQFQIFRQTGILTVKKLCAWF